MYIFNTLGSCYCLLKQWSAYIINSSACIINVWGYTEIFPIFYLAKSVKEHDNYKYCWAKDTAIYLRKSDNSRAIKITSLQDIEALRHSRDDASSHVNTTR